MKLFIVLHHSADASQTPQFMKVNDSHQRRGFPLSSLGYFVGYHWFIGFDGTVKQARSESEVGAHCNAKLMNYIGIGICLAGDFTKHKPNNAQIIALEKLLTEVQARWNIPDTNILLHRECKSTTCPAIDLRQYAIVYRNKKRLENPSTNPSAERSRQRGLARIAKWLLWI